jgi:type I restriction enzyme S subunit
MAGRDFLPFAELFGTPLRNGLTKPKAVRGAGMKMVNMGEVFAHRRIHNLDMDRVPIDSRERESSLLRAGDLLFARQSLVLSGAGKCVLFLGDKEDVTFESHIIRCRLDQRRADPSFYFYLFQSQEGRLLIESIVEQVAAAGIRGSDLGRLAVPVPPLDEQKAIAAVLGALDDKIELNRRMNATLEAMASALFQSWFVDFDQVRAKMEGRPPVGMDEVTAALFPDSFEDSELGHIPQGWEVVSLETLASIRGGKQLPTEDCLPTGKFTVFGANGIMGYTTESTHDGFVIAFGRVGAYCGSIHWSLDGSWINNNASAVVPLQWSVFVLQTMLNIDFDSMRTGSAQPFIPNSSLAAAKVLRPSSEVAEAFSRTVEAWRRQQADNDKQSRTLAILRDTLLPKLLGGELSVASLESKLETSA